MATVTWHLDVNRFTNDIQIFMAGVAEEDVERRARAVHAEVVRLIRQRADENTQGGLADSVRGEVNIDGPNDVTALIYSDAEHALWFEEGTGLYGPRGSMIFPKGNKAMSFIPRGLSTRVYAFKVRGQPGKHPFHDGLNVFD
jgi:hypothetical protein